MKRKYVIQDREILDDILTKRLKPKGTSWVEEKRGLWVMTRREEK